MFKNDWKNLFLERLGASYFTEIGRKLENEYAEHSVYPPTEDLFRAFNLSSFANTKVVILGQDPYHQVNQAHGLAFSVPAGIAFPPSLKNIFKELDHHQTLLYFRNSGDLTVWARQGVLLLNTVLSVRDSQPNSHKNLGWQTLTLDTIRLLNQGKSNIVFMLWGNFAFQFEKEIDATKHLILKAAHPSPLSANKGGWFGNNCFNLCNEYLKTHAIEPINWFESM